MPVLGQYGGSADWLHEYDASTPTLLGFLPTRQLQSQTLEDSGVTLLLAPISLRQRRRMDELSRLRMAELQEEEEEDTGSMLERAVEQAELAAKAEV